MCLCIIYFEKAKQIKIEWRKRKLKQEKKIYMYFFFYEDFYLNSLPTQQYPGTLLEVCFVEGWEPLYAFSNSLTGTYIHLMLNHSYVLGKIAVFFFL